MNVALRSPSDPTDSDGLFGARLVYDGTSMPADLAIARAILHTNLRIAPGDALAFAAQTARAAQRNGLPPEFLAAALLQESAYDPRAISAAGAVGVGQFMIPTAMDAGIDPFDPWQAIDGAAGLLGSYARMYAERSDHPLTLALAAYNAGPGAVAEYGGVPPYAETREYVGIIFDREARIFGYEIGSARRGAGFFGE
jgi:soluble lytic murein transglycosylase-like protein